MSLPSKKYWTFVDIHRKLLLLSQDALTFDACFHVVQLFALSSLQTAGQFTFAASGQGHKLMQP